jgi:hypothetical protein
VFVREVTSREDFSADEAGEAVYGLRVGKGLRFDEEISHLPVERGGEWVDQSVEKSAGLREGDEGWDVAFVDYGDAEFFG